MSTQEIIQAYKLIDGNTNRGLMHEPRAIDTAKFHRIADLGDGSRYSEHSVSGEILNGSSAHNVSKTMGGVGYNAVTGDFSFVMYIVVVPTVFALIVFFGTLGIHW